uniref:Uncharacterized protein n=1 Tax=viral metagenome TaxID=1070528 RepID=A0A6M3ISX0_9ZZZZ
MSSKQTSQKWITQNGRTLILPAWKGGQTGGGKLTLSDVDIRDTYAIQRYPVGTKLLDGERVFYYAKASSVGIDRTDYGVKNGYGQDVGYTTVAAAAAIGDKTLVIDIASHGQSSDGVFAANYLAGGFVVVFNHGDPVDSFVCRILENTATTGAGEMTLTLQDEIPVTLAAGDVDHAECMAHWALGCEYNTATEEPVVGAVQAAVAANYWFWLQTWGPRWLGPSSAGPFDGAHKHQAVFESTGEIDGHEYNAAALTEQQHAGFGLCHAVGGGQGAPFIMLQICP